MSKIYIQLLGCFLAIIVAACKKQNANTAQLPITSVTIVNAIDNSDPIIADLTGADSIAAYFATSTKIPYGSSAEYSIGSGAVPITVSQVTDTSHPLFHETLTLETNKIYSVLLTRSADGNHGADILVLTDSVPYYFPIDSSSGIRFINLYHGGDKLSIVGNGNLIKPDIHNFSYKLSTNFIRFPATFANNVYNFDIKDEEKDSLLATYQIAVSPFQNISLVISGDAQLGSFNIFSVNNF